MKLLFIILAIIQVAIIISCAFIPSEFVILARVLSLVVIIIGVFAYGHKHPSAMESRGNSDNDRELRRLRRNARRRRDNSNTGLRWLGGAKKKRRYYWDD